MTILTCKEEFPSWPRRTDVCLLSDPGEQVQHRHRFLKESRVVGGVRTIVVNYMVFGEKWIILYLGRPHLAKYVPETKCFISCSCHDGLSIRGHGLNTKSSSQGKRTALLHIDNRFIRPSELLILTTALILLTTDQVEHSVGMPCEFGHLGERGILPN